MNKVYLLTFMIMQIKCGQQGSRNLCEKEKITIRRETSEIGYALPWFFETDEAPEMFPFYSLKRALYLREDGYCYPPEAYDREKLKISHEMRAHYNQGKTVFNEVKGSAAQVFNGYTKEDILENLKNKYTFGTYSDQSIVAHVYWRVLHAFPSSYGRIQPEYQPSRGAVPTVGIKLARFLGNDFFTREYPRELEDQSYLGQRKHCSIFEEILYSMTNKMIPSRSILHEERAPVYEDFLTQLKLLRNPLPDDFRDNVSLNNGESRNVFWVKLLDGLTLHEAVHNILPVGYIGEYSGVDDSSGAITLFKGAPMDIIKKILVVAKNRYETSSKMPEKIRKDLDLIKKSRFEELRNLFMTVFTLSSYK